MKNKFIVVTYGLALLLLVSLAGAIPPFTPQSTVQTNALTIIYPKNTYIEGQDFKMHFHVHNSTGALVQPNTNNLNCSIHIYNLSNSHIIEQVLGKDSNGVDWNIALNTTTFNNAGEYPYVVWCDSDTEKGFHSGQFEITGDGRQYENEVSILAIVLLIITVFAIYFYISMNWDFTLFEVKGGTKNRQNAVKALFVWLGLWLIPLLIQITIELTTNVFGSSDILTLLNTLYQVSIWLNYFVSVYFTVFFIYNVALYLAGTSKVGK